MHKLQKAFADAINPRKVADFTKHKIDRFKNHLPVLQIICNPGLKERHWKMVKKKLFLIIILNHNIHYMCAF
jgi:dynein heavy chain